MKTDVAKFLSTGKAPAGGIAGVAEACRKEVHAQAQRSTKEAIKTARRFVAVATKHDRLTQMQAYRALGWALHVATRTQEALEAYLQARQLARKAPIIRARIDRILIDIHMYLGDLKKARRHSRLAMDTFRRHDEITEMEKTRVNYANLLHRQDRHRLAQRHYHRAGEHMEKAGERLVLGLCRYNEANTLVQLIEFPLAAKLYRSAEEIFGELGYDLYANEARYGRAWLSMLRGDYHLSLKLLAECDEAYRRHGQPRGSVLCELDRAEAFLGLNLMTDARDAARKAEREAKRLGMTYEAAKAALFFAKAAHATGQDRRAKTALLRAQSGFAREGNRPFEAAARFTSALIGGGDDRGLRLTRAREMFRRSQLPVWTAICDLTMMNFPQHEEAAFRRLRGNASVKSIPHLIAHWQTALGDRQARRNRWTQAKTHWTRAADLLDRVRAKLPPVELRSSFLKGRAGPYERLVASELANDLAASAAWTERFSTAGLWSPLAENKKALQARDRAREKLSDLAQQVTVLAATIERGSRRRALGTVESDRALVDLQREVRRNLATAESGLQSRFEAIDQLKKLFRIESVDRAVVQFHFDGEDLLAFVHCAGEVVSHRYLSGRRRLAEYLGWWQTVLSQHMFGRGRKSDREEAELFTSLGKWLWQPLSIPVKVESVLVLPTGQLADLPWPAIRFDNELLADRHHLVLAPSLRHHLRASQIEVDSDKVDLFVGPSTELAGVSRDVAILKQLCGRDLTVHRPARRADWLSAGTGRLWHYAGHAHLRRDNPFYSSLMLEDGPLFAADFRLLDCPVELVTLAACRTGAQLYLPGEESSGLVRSLLEMGARNVLAGLWAVDDRSTSYWMRQFYRRLFSGEPILQAVRSARRATRRKFGSAYHWAAFGIFGACRGDSKDD